MDNYEGHRNDSNQKVNSAFIAGIALNFMFVLVEVTAGILVNSLSLLSDAGHNLADVVTLALSLLAFRLMKVRPNEKYTYGYRKTSILVALFNTMFLLVSIGAIVYEAVHRLFSPDSTSGLTIAVVAAAGIVINGVTAYLFIHDKEKDLNIKSAYLHMLNDALISAGVVAGGVLIYFTGWYLIDSIFSIIISVFIMFSAWRLLRSSLRLSLDGVPGYISVDDIRNTALGIKGVRDMHHIHIWAISTTENALTAHLVLDENTGRNEESGIKDQLRKELAMKSIHHVTLETEQEDAPCDRDDC